MVAHLTRDGGGPPPPTQNEALLQAEVARLRQGIQAALGCYTHAACRVTLVDLLHPPEEASTDGE
jgi:hypothetical protein